MRSTEAVIVSVLILLSLGCMGASRIPEVESVIVYPVSLISEDGDSTLEGTIEQTLFEKVPITTQFDVVFEDKENMRFEWEVDGGSVLSVADWENGAVYIVLSSNVDTFSVSLEIRYDGEVYRWHKDDVDVPLHNNTQIVLDATQFEDEENIESVLWTAENWDPADSATFPIEDPRSPITTLVSEWPNDINFTCKITRTDGSVVENNVEALIYFRDGTPFAIRATYARLADPFTEQDLNTILNQEFTTLKRLGFNAIMHHEIQWYGYPDDDGNFAIQPFYADTWEEKDPRGYNPDPDELATYFDTAKEYGFGVYVQLRRWPYQNDPELRQEWGSGWGPHKWFRETDGWLYGNGEGLKHNLLSYIDLFVNHDVDGFFWDAESGDVEVHGGSKTRNFITDEIIPAYREAGYTGDISYALSYFHTNGDLTLKPMNPENLNPYVCGIPWGSDEIPYLGVTFYPTLATTNDATTEEMYEEALRQINANLVPFSETYNKPIFITECYCGGYDGASILTNDANLAKTRPADFGEQLSWHAALLRAFAHENQTRASPLIIGVTMDVYRLVLNQAIERFPPEWGILKQYLNDGNNRPDLQKLVKVYLSDKPLRTP